MIFYWTKINTIIDETPGIKTFLLDCPADFNWQEGAHTHFAMKGFNEGEKPNRSLVRHMSISTLPQEKLIGITTRFREPFSEYKKMLQNLPIGGEVALFGTSTNVPLKREGKNIYFLSAGVSLATFRPLVLTYFQQPEGIQQVYSLNIDSSKNYLFTDIFTSSTNHRFSSNFVDSRSAYYEEAKKIAGDPNGLYYIVGSDQFLLQNIALLQEHGVQIDQIILDKHPKQLVSFLPLVDNK